MTRGNGEAPDRLSILHLLAGSERMLAKVAAEQYPALRGREGQLIRISWKEDDVQLLDA